VKRLQAGGAQAGGRLLHLRLEILDDRLHRADDERQADEEQHEHDGRRE
jgi:hypothetical protein